MTQKHNESAAQQTALTLAWQEAHRLLKVWCETKQAKDQKAAFALLMKLLSQQARAKDPTKEDLVANLLVKLWEKPEQFAQANNLQNYIDRALTHREYDSYRKAKRQNEVSDEGLEGAAGFDYLQGSACVLRQLQAKQDITRVQQALSKMKNSDVLILKLTHGLTLSDDELVELAHRSNRATSEMRKAVLNAESPYEKAQLLYSDLNESNREKVLDRFLKARKRAQEKLQALMMSL